MIRWVVALAGVAAVGGMTVQDPAALPRETAVIAAVVSNAVDKTRHTDAVWLARRLGAHRSDRDFRLQPAYFPPRLWTQLAALGEQYNQLLDSSAFLTDMPGVKRVVLLDTFRTNDPPPEGLHLLTRPAFNTAGDSALVGHMFLCPGLCGSTRVLLLRRQDTEWVVVRAVKDLNY